LVDIVSDQDAFDTERQDLGPSMLATKNLSAMIGEMSRDGSITNEETR